MLGRDRGARTFASHASLRRALEHLTRAAKPLVLVGPEGAAAVPEILALADALGARVLTTPDGLSLVDGARSSGVYSFGASARARRLVAEADVVVAVSALGEFASRLGQAFRRHTLIQVVESLAEVRGVREPDVLLTGAVGESLTWLRVALGGPRATWNESFFEAEPANDNALAPVERDGVIDPVAALGAIQAALPEGARICLDITSGALHAYERLRVSTRERVFSSVENSACMGEALMASLGIRLASGAPTLVLVGDWGYSMAPSELHTAVELELDRYVVLVWANQGGAFIGAGVKQQGLRVPEAVWRWERPPAFAQVAAGLGARGVTVTRAEDLARELAAALAGGGPTLIEAKIDPSAVVPAGDRFLTLGVEG